jgi:hypothetical protein
MVRPRRAALAGVQGGQDLALDLQDVPRQDPGHHTHALEHDSAQRRVGFLTQVDMGLLVPTCPHVPVTALLAVKWTSDGRTERRTREGGERRG